MSETKKRKMHSAEFNAKVGLEALRGTKTINEIGKLKMELDGSKKVRHQPAMIRQSWIGQDDHVAVTQQCGLTGVARHHLCSSKTSSN